MAQVFLMDKIKTLTAENKRLRALNRKLKQRINVLRTITTEEAKLATKMDCTIDDILEAADPTEGERRAIKVDLLTKYLEVRDRGVLIKDRTGDLYFFRHHIPASLPFNRIERVLWCKKSDESVFMRSIEGHVTFINQEKIENWENCPEMHDYGLIALIGHCGDAGKSPIPQVLSHYVIL